jgi:hypothetical protein
VGFEPKKLCANRKGWTDNETRDICQRSWNNKLKQGTNRRIKWAWPRLRNFIFPTFTICCSRGRAFAPFDSTFGWQRLVSTSCRLVLDGLLLFKTYDWECDHIYIIYYYYYYYYYYIYIYPILNPRNRKRGANISLWWLPGCGGTEQCIGGCGLGHCLEPSVPCRRWVSKIRDFMWGRLRVG